MHWRPPWLGSGRQLTKVKVSLCLGPNASHTLRFDEAELDDIVALMRAIPFRQAVRISDFRRNILGTWRAGELRDAVAQLSILSPNQAKPLTSPASAQHE